MDLQDSCNRGWFMHPRLAAIVRLPSVCDPGYLISVMRWICVLSTALKRAR
jgi:hypothetical protein